MARNPDPDIPDDDDLTRQQYEVDLDRCLGYFGPRAVIKWAIDYLERQLTATPRDPDTEPF